LHKYFSTFISILITLLTVYSHHRSLIPKQVCVTFVVVTLFLLFFFQGKRRSLFRQYQPQIEGVEENINILSEDIKSKDAALSILPHKAEYISSLSKIVDKFTSLVEKDKIDEFLLSQLARFFTKADNILLFMFNRDENILELSHSFKRNKIIIKEKHGDFMDWWVLRHNQSLLIEDFTEDFRFDCNVSPAYNERKILSFIISPISLGDKVMGVVRVESTTKQFFSLDDLRILRILCDVAAAVLERASIFHCVEELATKDALTDLYLREVFLDRLKEELVRAKMTQTELALGVLDIDDFKHINDRNGHTIGDLVLKKTAGLLTQIVGNSGNIVSRYGGEEFVFFLVRSDKKKAKQTAERIREEVSKVSIGFRRRKINFTSSLGLAFYPDDGKNFLDLMKKADALLYKAKREGKNRVCSTA